MKKSFFVLFIFISSYALNALPLDNHHQVLLVISDNWDTLDAEMTCFERNNEHAEWVVAKKTIPVSIGKTGLAWSKGLHPNNHYVGPQKKEGDNKAPAGIYEMGPLFGLHDKNEALGFNMPYIHFTSNLEAVDDQTSKYYNQIVDVTTTPKDWNSTEKLSTISLYDWGSVISFNENPPIPGVGSCVYMHIWRAQGQGTAGCTAMSRENLLEILHWMKEDARPVIVQLTKADYKYYSERWGLPKL